MNQVLNTVNKLEINYGEILLKSALREVIEARYERDLSKLTACEQGEYAKEVAKTMEILRDETNEIYEKSKKNGIALYCNGEIRGYGVCEIGKPLVDESPKWLYTTLYHSPLPLDDHKMNFKAEPIKLTPDEERVVKATDIKTYSLSCTSDVLVKDLGDLIKAQLNKTNKAITGVLIGYEKKVIRMNKIIGRS